MSFAYPAFLGFLAILAIPVIIHLFNFKKYKRILFSDIRFLKEIQEKTKKQSQLKYWIILTCRLLAFMFLVFAFAQPYSGNNTAVLPNQATLVYIDNSFSMEALGKNGSLLDVAKEKARELVKSSNENAKFQILTNDFAPNAQRLCSKEEALEIIETIKVSPLSRTAEEILSREKEIIKNYSDVSFNTIHISDFQKSFFNYEKAEYAQQLNLLPLQPQTSSNISIDSVWFNNPLHIKNGLENFYFKATNHNTTETKSITLQLKLNNQQKAVTTITIPPATSVDSSFSYTNTQQGIIQGQLILNDEQVQFDDVFYFTYKIQSNIKIGCISNFKQNKDTVNYPVKNIFVNDSYYHFKSYTLQNLDFGELKTKDLIVLNQLEELSSGLQEEIKNHVSTGGQVCVIPSVNADVNSYNGLLSSLGLGQFSQKDTSRIPSAKPDLDDAFYSGIFEKKINEMDVPQIKVHFPLISNNQSLTHNILVLKNGDPLLARVNYKKGQAFLFTSPLDERAGNFVQHALLVPVLLRIGELSSANKPLFQTFGKDAYFEIKSVQMNGESNFQLKGLQQGESFVPEHRSEGNLISVYYNDEMTYADNFNLLLNEQIIDGSSLNYDRKESTLTPLNSEELQAQLAKSGIKNYSIYNKPIDDSKINMASLSPVKHYWVYCIWIMLLFLTIETLLLKLWKTV